MIGSPKHVMYVAWKDIKVLFLMYISGMYKE